MAGQPGSRIGPYEIIEEIGAGGMGTVYRAHDSRLGRDVAIKVSAERFSERFEREARAVAALNHPNICTLHDVGPDYLVMELVEGETLADALAARPAASRGLPVDEALRLAKQIAAALEAAHEKGIVHRDLKPGNIKIKPDGSVKVLDFGLAKVDAAPPDSSSDVRGRNLTHSPTLAATQVGLILGTAAYMAPEQARGKPVDKRADIWAFGAVLFEMLTGTRAFEGEDVSQTIASVLAREPDWMRLPSDVSPVLAIWLRRCLQKDPKQRIGDIHDVRLALEGAFDGPATTGDIATLGRSIWRRVALVAVVAAGIGAALTAGLLWAFTPSPSPPVTRSRFVLPSRQEVGTFLRQVVDVSSDGSALVYNASLDANSQLFLRRLSELTARPIQGTESSLQLSANLNPVFSPDGNSIAYHDGALKRIPVRGGTPVTLSPTDIPWGMSWAGDWIIWGQGPKGISRISANGGVPEQLVSVQSNEVAAHPQLLPGGGALLFTLAMAGNEGEAMWDSARIIAYSLDTGERKTIIEGGSHARYVPPGHLVFAQGTTLFAAPFDVRRLEVTGGRVSIIEGLTRNYFIGDGAAQYSVSANGTLIFVPSPVSAGASRLVTIDHDGKVTPVGVPPAGYRSLRISPDGRQVVYDTAEASQGTIWIYNLAGGSPTRRLTFTGRNRYPIWSSDGQRIVFQSDRDGRPGLYWQRADGTGTAERLTTPEENTSHIPESWSPVGNRFSFSAIAPAGASLWVFSLPEKMAERFSDIQSNAALNSEFSPDGKWLAYTLRNDRAANVYVEPFPATGEKNQITSGNGHHPVWRSEGLSYRIAADEQVIVSVTTSPGFAVGNPVPVLSRGAPTVESTANRSYDFTPDGRMIAIAREVDGEPGNTTPTEIEIVLNWTEELKRLVPSSR